MVLLNVVSISDPIDQGVIRSWKGIPVQMCCSNDLYFILGWFREGDGNYTGRAVCQLPEDLDVVKAVYGIGSSMFALLCKNGCLLLLRSN
ncbi:hypothetical protein M378DRAFT_162224 [Amanita muscaria Koide BX008]|uniref:Uncharacterized protein n=1 Tax=Amanita muscaria (strain Koide BX008) TaxID=946122 RepID=A0A0C2TEL6_AMAMK|nr:hypothetical protein M378DRAFT_162224 [Amanita muscaria Koide BX008]